MSRLREARIGSVAAVVLNWNGVTRTCQAITSLLAQSLNVRVVLVDNGSRGDDVAVFKQHFDGDPVTIVTLPENVGFSRALNAGAIVAMHAGAEFLLLFNNDALIEKNSMALQQSLAALLADATLGAAGPIICNDDALRTIQSVSYTLSMWFPIPRAKRRIGHRATLRPTSYLSGSCLLLRARAFAAVGGFDPDFFFYGEDVDFARRLHKANYRQRLISARGVSHARGASIGLGSVGYVYTALRSTLILIYKHARWYHMPSAAATCVAASVALAGRGVLSGNRGAVSAVFRAWSDFIAGRWGGFTGTRLLPARRPSLTDLFSDFVTLTPEKDTADSVI